MMKNLLKRNKLFLLGISLLLFVSCSSDDNDPPMEETGGTIVETAQDTEALNSLVAALTAADQSAANDLIGTLSGDGPFTVFAPTNEAFSTLLGQLDAYDDLDDFDDDADREILATILTYHVIGGVAARSTDLSDGQLLTTVQGEQLTVNIDNGVFIEDASGTPARVVTADVETSNGIVHLIDKVLLPQVIIDAINNADDDDDEELGTLVDVVVAAESLSILEAAVIKADLAATLSGAGPFTVFAPSDEAFVALLDILGDNYNSLDDFDTEAELQLLTDILLYHVVSDEVLASELAAGNVPTALSGSNIEVIASGDTFVLGDASEVNANITGTDILASNGVAHTIDKVLLPQAAIDFVAAMNLGSIVDIAVATDDLSLLVEALQQADAGLVETLGGEGPFTVFAPTNAAFAALLDFLGDDYNSLADFDTAAEKELLAKVLTYHVVSGTAAFSTALSNGQVVPTVQGENLTVALDMGSVQLDDATDTNATVVLADVEASNGVVHVIDKVLLPQEALDFVASLNPGSIVDIAVATDDLSLLVEALQQADAGLVETLGGEGPFTVFAPTNAAFAALLDVLGDDYNSLADFDTAAEKVLLAKVLTYHVVSGTAAFSTALSNGQVVPTVQGENLTVVLDMDSVQLDDPTDANATVLLADVEASNGVVHVIDKVLLPQEVLTALGH